jgi:hypothetical protein
MASKKEIKDILNVELTNSSLYNEILLLKQFIINSINAPGLVSSNLIYNFNTSLQNDQEISMFKLCFKNEFGFTEDNMNNDVIIIDMSKFLE